MVRIALVEDHIMFRQGMKLALEQMEGFSVVCEASCGAEYEQIYDPKKVDITILDLRLNGQNGAITCQNLRRKYPDIKIIINSFSEDPELILEMIRYGARAYIPKGKSMDYVERTIRMVMEHGRFFDQDLGAMMNIEMNKAYKKTFIQDEFRVTFSDIEMKIAVMACSGCSIEQMSETLRVSKRMVEMHRTNMQIKTDSNNFHGVVVYMFKHFLLFPHQF